MITQQIKEYLDTLEKPIIYSVPSENKDFEHDFFARVKENTQRRVDAICEQFSVDPRLARAILLEWILEQRSK